MHRSVAIIGYVGLSIAVLVHALLLIIKSIRLRRGLQTVKEPVDLLNYLEQVSSLMAKQVLFALALITSITVLDIFCTSTTVQLSRPLEQIANLAFGKSLNLTGVLRIGIAGIYLGAVVLWGFFHGTKARHQIQILWVFRKELSLNMSSYSSQGGPQLTDQ